MHALLAYRCVQVAYGPVRMSVCTHVVSNRYRGYRQTGGEINAHRSGGFGNYHGYARGSMHVIRT